MSSVTVGLGEPELGQEAEAVGKTGRHRRESMAATVASTSRATTSPARSVPGPAAPLTVAGVTGPVRPGNWWSAMRTAWSASWAAVRAGRAGRRRRGSSPRRPISTVSGARPAAADGADELGHPGGVDCRTWSTRQTVDRPRPAAAARFSAGVLRRHRRRSSGRGSRPPVRTAAIGRLAPGSSSGRRAGVLRMRGSSSSYDKCPPGSARWRPRGATVGGHRPPEQGRSRARRRPCRRRRRW